MEHKLIDKPPCWDDSLSLREQMKRISFCQTIEGDTLHFQFSTQEIPDDVMFDYELYFGKQKIRYAGLSVSPSVDFVLPGGGVYRVKGYLVRRGEKCSRYFDEIDQNTSPLFDPSKTDTSVQKKKSCAYDLFTFGDSSIFANYPTELYESLLGMSDTSYFTGKNQEAYERAVQLLNYRLQGVDMRIPFSWSFPSELGRLLPYRCHSFTWLADLLTEYWKTSDVRYRDRFLQYVFDWIRAHPQVDLRDEWAWNDDTTARRCCFLCMTYALFCKILTDDQIRTLRVSAKMHANLLCKEHFYRRHHNHGMFQDRAVALYGLVFAEEAEYYLFIAKERVSEYFEFSLTTDGVHKEHSPLYHMDIARSIYWFYIAYSNVDKMFSHEMELLLKKMAEYIVWITQPDGFLPSIGDSPSRAKVTPLWAKDPAYQWVCTEGQVGAPPVQTGRIFWEAGYGILRSSWNMNKADDTWMMLLAATHSKAHKHHDDLSFLLYHKGPLFVEAGNRNYNYSEKKTQYTYSSHAHNVLFVNEEGWKMNPATGLPLLETEAYRTRIIEGHIQGNIQYVTGRQTRFPGVTQERTLRYRRTLQIVQIEDRIILEQEARLRLIYHIAPGVEVIPEENGWLLLRERERVARVSADGTGNLTLTTITGEGNDPWRTWIFGGNQVEQQGSLLIVDFVGKSGENLICMHIQLL